MSQQPPPKRDVMLALLQQSDSVYVQFDPRREGVVIPAHLKRQPRVVLQYGMNMAIPIPDLEIGERGISATLSFSHTPSWTFVPWTAVFAIVSNDQEHGMLWEADVPRDPEGDGRKRPEPVAATAKPKPGVKPKPRPVLRAVPSQAQSPGEAAEPAAPEPAAPEPAATPVTLLSSARKAEPAAPTEAAASPPASPRSSPPASLEAAESADPSAAATSPEDESAAPAAEAPDAPEPAPAAPPRRDATATPRKKRELPPYLRVVK